MRSMAALFLLIAVFSGAAAAAPENCANGQPTTINGIPDGDADGVANPVDNCLNLPNSLQRDTDGDSFGNLCDADFNNDLAVNFADLSIFKTVFLTNDEDADLNGDGFVNFVDLGLFKTLFLNPPGPTGPCLADPSLCSGPADFEFDDTGKNNPGSLVVFRTNDPATIYHARRLGSGASVCNPSVAASVFIGNEAYNPMWSFHLGDNISFHGTNIEPIELCDATAGYIENNLPFWCGVESGGTQCMDWCPWHSLLTQEVGSF